MSIKQDTNNDDDEAQYEPRATEEQAKEFEEKLKKHNWYYEMADDNKTFSEGQRNEIELRNRAINLGLYGLFKHYKERTRL